MSDQAASLRAGREKVGKKGVVRDPAVHQEVIRKSARLCHEYFYGAMSSFFFAN